MLKPTSKRDKLTMLPLEIRKKMLHKKRARKEGKIQRV